MPEKVVVSVLIGTSPLTAIPNICKVTLNDDYLVAESRKGTSTYLEYDIVRALAFEPKEIADRQAGFV